MQHYLISKLVRQRMLRRLVCCKGMYIHAYAHTQKDGFKMIFKICTIVEL